MSVKDTGAAGDPGGTRRLRPEDLADLEAVAQRLDLSDTPAARDLHRRVRQAASKSGVDLGGAPARALSLLLGAAGLNERDRPGHRLARAQRWLRAAFVTVGVVAGALATTGVLVYDAARPVNVLTFLSLLVGVQILFLLILIAGLLLGGRLESAVPFIGRLRRTVSEMRSRLSRGPGSDQEGGPHPRLSTEESLYAGIDRWRSVALMQWLAVGFNIGIVLALFARLAVTDVVVGWSTTLPAVVRLFPSLIEMLSFPWASWLPSAVPDPAMVDATRYVRIGAVEVAWAGGELGPDVLLFSGWWQLLLMSVLVYGLLPRALMLSVCAFMVRRKLSWAMSESRRLERLRRRMSAPLIEVEADTPSPAQPDAGQEEPGEHGGPPAVEATTDRSTDDIDGEAMDLGPCALVLWGDVPDPDEALGRALESRMGARVTARLKAGGLAFEETEEAIARLTSGTLARMPLVLVAEAYEAPAEELERFLQATRGGGDPGRVVIVALVDVLEEDGWTEASPEDEAMWRTGLRRLPGTGSHVLGPVRLAASEGGS